MQANENEKLHYQKLLEGKKSFTPLEVDYERLYEIKQKTNEAIKNDLNINIVQFHEERHKANQININHLEK
jgi:hypothetical protein